MKRIISACLEQTQKFETEGYYQTYIKGLERKRVNYKIVDKQQIDTLSKISFMPINFLQSYK